MLQTAKLNDVDPLAWLTDVLERIVSGQTRRTQLHRLLPWNWAVEKAHSVNSASPRESRGSHATLTVEGHVEDPVQPVFDPPMSAYRLSGPFGAEDGG